MFIAIEGIDGAGKTTVANALAQKIGLEYSSQKALSAYMCIEDNLYLNYCTTYRNTVDKDPNSMFMLYGLSCYLSGCKKNVVCDRHLPTVYFWYGTDASYRISDVIYSVSSKPDITFILDVNVEIAKQRILKKYDEKIISKKHAERDFSKAAFAPSFVSRVEPFLKHFDLAYEIIDTNHKSIDMIVDEILTTISDRGLLFQK